MKILVTGAGGQVGTALRERGAIDGIEILAFDRAALDITDAAATLAAVEGHSPEAVINAAAYTAVDKAEGDIERAFAINATGAENLAKACDAAGIPFLHISTDFVFDGSKSGPYVETDAVGPLNVYGRSKAEGEARIAAVMDRHIILRTAWVFGGAQNFVNTMLRLGAEREELSIVDDQRGGPTASFDIAATLLHIARAVREPGFNDFGIYHYSGAPSVTWYGFACAIFKGRSRPRLKPIRSEEYPAPAARPKNSVLDCTKIKRVFDIDQPDWQAALSRIIGP